MRPSSTGVSWKDVTGDHLARHFTANFASLVALCRALVPAMAERGWGRVVATAASWRPGRVPRPSPMRRSSRRNSLAIRAIAREVAPRGHHERVSPGAIETERTAVRYADAAFRRAVAAKIPVGRPGRPEDCVGPCDLPVPDEAAYLTGVTSRRWRLDDRRCAGLAAGGAVSPCRHHGLQRRACSESDRSARGELVVG